MEQPTEPPAITTGMRLEINTQVVEEVEGGEKQYLQWLPGVVTCISDGSQPVVEHLPGKNVRKRKRAGQPRRDKGPAGWVCVKFDDGFEDWFLMNSDSFNNAAMRSWRLDLDFVCDGGEPAEE